jgi:hypothetical protein
MLLNIAVMAFALQMGAPATPLLSESAALVQEVRHRRRGHPLRCEDGYDLDSRDGRCYPNGKVPPEFQSGQSYPLEYGGGRRPVPCGNGADVDIRDGLCYRTGTVPRRWQQGRLRYQRRDGYYVLE